METTTVVHIPSVISEASPIRLEEIKLVNVGPGGINEDECKDFEKRLEHFPDIREHIDAKTFSWAHRSLVGIAAKNVVVRLICDAAWKRDHMLYVCVGAKADPSQNEHRLPYNEYLNKILDDSEGGRQTQPTPIVYGDAFVFKKEPKPESPEFERATYTEMDQLFVDRLAKNDPRAVVIVKKLLRVNTAGDFDYV